MPSFQSTYPHGVRPNLLASLVRCSHFNPRTRTGYDEKACNAAWTEYISIHVPARGTTPASVMRVSFFKFQSTYPHGVRRAVVFPKTSEYRFQSTYPHGVRRQLLLWRAPPAEFQSTYPHGVRRPVKIYTRPRITISIHVPARGTTPARSTLQGPDHISIHVPARGTTAKMLAGIVPVVLFQSTYPHGVRP